MSSYSKYQICIGLLIVFQAFILLDSSWQRHHFQLIVSTICHFFGLEQPTYRFIEIIRFGLVAMMYTSGASIIFDVGLQYVLVYFRSTICIGVFRISFLNGINYIRNMLVICVYAVFFAIIRNISLKQKDEIIIQTRQKQTNYFSNIPQTKIQ